MPIDRQEVVDAANPHFPPTTDFYTNDELLEIADQVITQFVTEDTNVYFGEAVCKYMKAVCNLAKGKYANEGNVRRDRQLESELEWQEYHDIWSAFEDSLEFICPLFGYAGLTSKRVNAKKVESVFRPKFVVNPYVD